MLPARALFFFPAADSRAEPSPPFLDGSDLARSNGSRHSPPTAILFGGDSVSDSDPGAYTNPARSPPCPAPPPSDDALLPPPFPPSPTRLGMRVPMPPRRLEARELRCAVISGDHAASGFDADALTGSPSKKPLDPSGTSSGGVRGWIGSARRFSMVSFFASSTAQYSLPASICALYAWLGPLLGPKVCPWLGPAAGFPEAACTSVAHTTSSRMSAWSGIGGSQGRGDARIGTESSGDSACAACCVPRA
eukprot:2722330-Rhodomonas_salina.1